MVLLYIVRHGQTENNRKGILMGQLDSPLTDSGIRNAEFLAGRLKGAHFDRVYSSDLGRAFITAHIISERLGIYDRLERARELREIDFGEFSNCSKNKISEELIPFSADLSKRFPGGESVLDMSRRGESFIRKIRRKHKNEAVLAVTHSGMIRAVKCHLNGWELKDHVRMQIGHHYIGKFEINGRNTEYEKLSE